MKVRKEGNIGRRILDHVSKTISKSDHHKGGLSATPFIQNNYFLKEGVVWEQSEEVGNIERRILDHFRETISKSAHHKRGPCLQLDLYKNLIFSKKESSGNKVNFR